MSPRRRRVLAALAASGAGGAMGALPRAVSAQGVETARILIGFAPGGTIDLVGRRVAEKLQGSHAKTALVDNRTGAGGQIAVQAVRNAAPDATTILLTPTSPLSLHYLTYRKVPYEVADLAPVSGAASFDYALAVGPMVPATVRTAPEFLAWCKANPDKANFGSAGNGSAAHFLGAALGKAGQTDVRHVAFRGSQPAVLDMIGGQIAAVVGPTGDFMPNVQAGKIRLLGTSGPKRGAHTPQMPTFAEQGFRDVAYTGWFGFYVPAKTPADAVQRLNAAIRSALAAPDTAAAFAASYMEPMPTSPEQLATLLKAETEFWSGLVKSVGFTPEG